MMLEEIVNPPNPTFVAVLVGPNVSPCCAGWIVQCPFVLIK